MATNALARTVFGFLSNAKLSFEADIDRDDGESVLFLRVFGDQGTWNVFIQVSEQTDVRRVVVHSQLPARIPEGNRHKLADLLTRINYDLTLGNFELGMDDGELLFKTAIDLADGELTRRMFWGLYDANCQAMNRYFAKIAELAFGGDAEAILDVRPPPDRAVLH